MKAIQYRAYGGYAENKLVDLPAPAANDGQVLVRMRTVGINPLDNIFRSGHDYAATPENLPRVGAQMGAGMVETKSPSFKVGDRVFVTGPGFGVIADGTWRELLATPAAGLMPIPSHVDDDQAAAFLAGAGYLTGYLVLTEFVAFKPGQSAAIRYSLALSTFHHQFLARRPPQAIKSALLIQKGPKASPKQRHNKAPKACQDALQSGYTLSSNTLTIFRTYGTCFRALRSARLLSYEPGSMILIVTLRTPQ